MPTTYASEYLSEWANEPSGGDFHSPLVAGLSGGYLVAWNSYSSPLTDRFTMVSTTTGSVVSYVDYPAGSTFVHDSQQDSNNNNWVAFYTYGTAFAMLATASQTGGTLSINQIGALPTTYTGSSSSNGFVNIYPSNDTSELAVWDQTFVSYPGTATVRGVNTADATENWSWTPVSLGHGTATPPRLVGSFGASRVLMYCTTHDDLELWDDTGSLLDSIAPPTDYHWSGRDVFPIGADLIVASTIGTTTSSDPQAAQVKRLSAAGDVLSYLWSTDITTDWGPTRSWQSPALAGAGDAITLVSTGGASGTATAMSLYVIDGATGTSYPSTPDSHLIVGLDAGYSSSNVLAFAGTDRLVVNGDAAVGSIWSVIGTRSAPTYLRRRQSPAYTPSRVRGVDIRQRQTPIITRP